MSPFGWTVLVVGVFVAGLVTGFVVAAIFGANNDEVQELQYRVLDLEQQLDDRENGR
jgi:uncharacterized membrane-anchored protein YhcB (DUF1043 family)